MRRGGFLAAALVAAAALGATALLPARVEQVARSVEEIRGRRFQRAVPASEIEGPELKQVLRAKLTGKATRSASTRNGRAVSFWCASPTPPAIPPRRASRSLEARPAKRVRLGVTLRLAGLEAERVQSSHGEVSLCALRSCGARLLAR
jgi:hypothetical protein